MIQRQSHDFEKNSLWSAPSQFVQTQWYGLDEVVSSKSMIRGLSSANQLIQYCVSRGLGRSEKYRLPSPPSRHSRVSDSNESSVQLQMFDSSNRGDGMASLDRIELSREKLDYEYAFLRRIILQNYGGLHALVPRNFETECMKFPFKDTLRHALSTVDQMKTISKFNGYDTRCIFQPLSLPEMLSARYVAQQWCERETRPFETLTKGLFEYGMLIGIQN